MERTAEVERLTERGCSVFCLDCPEGMLFGIDYAAWTVGPRFMGVKLVPAGVHYVYSSATADDVNVARTGFFLCMRPRDVAVFRWDPASEELVRLVDLDEEARYADAVRGFDFDANLGPYPLQLAPQWLELTRHATPELVSKVEPVAKAVRATRAEYDAEREGSACGAPPALAEAVGAPSTGEAPMDEDMPEPVPQAKPQAQAQARSAEPRLESNAGSSGGLFFSSVPRGRKRTGSTPAETTRLHLDRTVQLDEMISREYGNDEMSILGEMQLAYIAFILGQNYDGFEQWRLLLQLLCGCEAAVAARPKLFAELCRAFFAQLSQAPGDLFGSDLTKDNFMGSCALSLIELCDAEGLPARLRKRCGKLRELVQQKFGITSEDLALIGEDAPQIVEADGRDLVDLSGPALMGLD